MGLMLSSPFIGALLGALAYLVYGPATAPIELFNFSSNVTSRAGFGAFMGLLASLVLGAVSLSLHVLCAVGAGLIKRWKTNHSQNETNA